MLFFLQFNRAWTAEGWDMYEEGFYSDDESQSRKGDVNDEDDSMSSAPSDRSQQSEESEASEEEEQPSFQMILDDLTFGKYREITTVDLNLAYHPMIDAFMGFAEECTPIVEHWESFSESKKKQHGASRRLGNK